MFRRADVAQDLDSRSCHSSTSSSDLPVDRKSPSRLLKNPLRNPSHQLTQVVELVRASGGAGVHAQAAALVLTSGGACVVVRAQARTGKNTVLQEPTTTIATPLPNATGRNHGQQNAQHSTQPHMAQRQTMPKRLQEATNSNDGKLQLELNPASSENTACKAPADDVRGLTATNGRSRAAQHTLLGHPLGARRLPNSRATRRRQSSEEQVHKMLLANSLLTTSTAEQNKSGQLKPTTATPLPITACETTLYMPWLCPAV